MDITIKQGLTFDDVLLIPQYSDIVSRNDVSVSGRFSRNVPLNIPIVSSPMDTVTESEMAIGLARNGGLGVIHRFQSIADQAAQVSQVKNKESHYIENPFSISRYATVEQLRQLQSNQGIGTILIDDSVDPQASPTKRKISTQLIQGTKLKGIVTNRDIKFQEGLGDQVKVETIMTPLDKMVVVVQKQGETLPGRTYFHDLMVQNRIEKIPIIDQDGFIMGLLTLKDITRDKQYPLANLDKKGQLYVGASIGATGDFLERASVLVEHGVDVLVVDVANGHNQLTIDAVKKLRHQLNAQNAFHVDIVAGSIATGEGALKLIEAGANGIRCGIGNGSICITRLVAGAGVPQLSALMDVAPICQKYNVPLISDGGNRNSGNMCKALCAGANCVMLGRLVAGTNESPSKAVYRDGKLQKVFRGMAGYGANVSKSQRTGEKEASAEKFTPEGVEGYIPYAGPLKDVLHQFVMGIKSGFSYVGGRNIQDAQAKASFIRITQQGFRESGVHDINKI